MRFAVSMELDAEAERNARAVQRFADALADALDRDYGPDLQNLIIGIICMRSRPGYEDWYKPRRPRFQARQQVRLLDGTSKELANTFGYDVRLTDDEYEQFVLASHRDAVQLVSTKLIDSLSVLDKLPSKVRKFDRPRFQVDFERESQIALAQI